MPIGSTIRAVGEVKAEEKPYNETATQSLTHAGWPKTHNNYTPAVDSRDMGFMGYAHFGFYATTGTRFMG